MLNNTPYYWFLILFILYNNLIFGTLFCSQECLKKILHELAHDSSWT